MKKSMITALALCGVMTAAMAVSVSADGEKVGVSMPTKDLQRWNQDGANMEAELKEAGYEVELQFASNDPKTQLDQITTMIGNGCDVLVISAIEGDSLGKALDMAKENDIPVIAYDRLLMNSDAVSYYATFDNYMVGTVQGNYIVEALDLENAEGPFNLEITAGDPGDNNATYFYNGAMDVLKPYIESGKLVVKSGQTEFSDVATPQWRQRQLSPEPRTFFPATMLTAPTSTYGSAPMTPPLSALRQLLLPTTTANIRSSPVRTATLRTQRT